jgi:hypothetical protein
VTGRFREVEWEELSNRFRWTHLLTPLSNPPPTTTRLFPPFSSIRPISASVSARVAAFAVERGLGSRPAGVSPTATHAEWTAYFRQQMWGAEIPLRSKL